MDPKPSGSPVEYARRLAGNAAQIQPLEVNGLSAALIDLPDSVGAQAERPGQGQCCVRASAGLSQPTARGANGGQRDVSGPGGVGRSAYQRNVGVRGLQLRDGPGHG